MSTVPRKTCTKETPRPANAPASEFWKHPDAVMEYDGDSYERYECPNCGLRFSVTIPD